MFHFFQTDFGKAFIGFLSAAVLVVLAQILRKWFIPKENEMDGLRQDRIFYRDEVIRLRSEVSNLTVKVNAVIANNKMLERIITDQGIELPEQYNKDIE